ncbi:plasmid transfer protein [Mucilaginibacter sp. AW1-7]|uniref:plasmid transfer protein n=1 Tax=Mucilaginibacter sp. AW1-7 TaxID=3349874 RepID=UPI003F73B593
MGWILCVPGGIRTGDQSFLRFVMRKRFAVYKGLQKPLIFRGFKGKFIYWGLASLLTGLVLGALVMSLINMWLGALVLIGCIVGGLLYTASRQKQGLHGKTRTNGIYIINQINHYGRKESF